MLNLALLRYNYLAALDTPIDCAAVAYQGLDLNESLLIRFVGLELFAGRTTELFLIAFSDMVPPNITSPDIHLTPASLAFDAKQHPAAFIHAEPERCY
jgi:hypothetical protein